MAERRGVAQLRIMEAYERAKRNNPSLTQGQFMRQGAPGAKLEKAPGKFKNDESAARYFRKIRSGERSGAAMYEASKPSGAQRGLYQLRAKLADGRFISSNMEVVSAYSTFDAPNVEYMIRTHRAEQIEAMILHYQSRYGMAEADVDMESIEVRQVSHTRKPIRMRLNAIRA